MAEDQCHDCKAHGRIEEVLINIKEWEKDAKETLKHIITAKASWAFFVVFLSICLGVVGFLWHGQLAIWNNVNLNHKEAMAAIRSVSDKVLVIDYKVQRHLDDTELIVKKNGKK
jgi:hypothetical protein